MFKRPYFQSLLARMQEPRKWIQVLAGPRQVGKTTLVQQVLEAAGAPYRYVSADAVLTQPAVWLASIWEAARLEYKQSGASHFILAIDEIQKLDNWSELVKKEWDADTQSRVPIQLMLSGSSRLLLQRGLTESLVGRFELHYLPHWSFSEMQTAFGYGIDDYVLFGAYPGAAALTQDYLRWKNYLRDAFIEPSISRDILALTRIDKPALLRQLFEFGASYTGQILSYNKMLGQLHDAGNTVTLAHYLNLFDGAGLLTGIMKHSGSKVMQKQSSPKFQVQNNALSVAYLPQSPTEIRLDAKLWGRLVESAVGAHLVNCAKTDSQVQVYYWREGNDEVDFVLIQGQHTIAIEVKSNNSGAVSGLKQFQKQYPDAKVLLVGQQGLDLETFLKIKPIDLF